MCLFTATFSTWLLLPVAWLSLIASGFVGNQGVMESNNPVASICRVSPSQNQAHKNDGDEPNNNESRMLLIW